MTARLVLAGMLMMGSAFASDVTLKDYEAIWKGATPLGTKPKIPCACSDTAELGAMRRNPFTLYPAANCVVPGFDADGLLTTEGSCQNGYVVFPKK